MENIKIFACNSAEKFTKKICENLGIEIGERDSFKFANDNSFVQLKESVRGKDVYIVQTTQPPVNERIMELLIMIETAKRIKNTYKIKWLLSIKEKTLKAKNYSAKIQKIKNTASVSPKLISEDILREKRKRYFGTLILVKIAALPRSEPIPPLVESLKKEKIIFPQKRNIV